MILFRTKTVVSIVSAFCIVFMVFDVFRLSAFVPNTNNELKPTKIDEESEESKQLNDKFNFIRNCGLERAEKCAAEDFFRFYPSNLTKFCGLEPLAQQLQVRSYANGAEVKFGIQPKPVNTPMKVLTLGIGNNIKSELKMKVDYPAAVFYGADPIAASGSVYTEIGWYIQTAVGVRDGSFRSKVFQNDRYSNQIVRTKSFFNLTKSFGLRVIDLLLMDIEGPEYDLLPLFTQENLLKEQVTICQLNVELHGKLKKFGQTDENYKQIMMNFLKDSPFVPVKYAKTGHCQATFVNVLDDYCWKTYLNRPN